MKMTVKNHGIASIVDDRPNGATDVRLNGAT